MYAPLIDIYQILLQIFNIQLITKIPFFEDKILDQHMFPSKITPPNPPQTLLQLHTFILENPSLDVSPHLASLSDVKKRLVEKILIDLRKSHSKARCHRTKLAISNEREQMKCNLVSFVGFLVEFLVLNFIVTLNTLLTYTYFY